MRTGSLGTDDTVNFWTNLPGFYSLTMSGFTAQQVFMWTRIWSAFLGWVPVIARP